ncbi:MAG: hypothetical protein MR911_10965 [Spirochaetia bacterium]|nr:hypothetical protein [Spirochaetia bacterium]
MYKVFDEVCNVPFDKGWVEFDPEKEFNKAETRAKDYLIEAQEALIKLYNTSFDANKKFWLDSDYFENVREQEEILEEMKQGLFELRILKQIFDLNKWNDDGKTKKQKWEWSMG